MSQISFKKFSEFVDLEGEVSDEQINEIFGFFKNNDKIEKLKADREKLKAQRDTKAAALDKALANMKAGKKPGVVANDDLEGALSASDRKFLAKDDAYRDRQAIEIRRKLGIKEAKSHNVMGWNVLDCSYITKGEDPTDVQCWKLSKDGTSVKVTEFFGDWSVEDSQSTAGAPRGATQKAADEYLKAIGAPTTRVLERSRDMHEAVDVKPLKKVKEPGWYVVDTVDKPVEGPMQEGAAKDRAEELSGEVTGDIPAYDVLYFDAADIKKMNESEESQDTLDELIEDSIDALNEEHQGDAGLILDSIFEGASDAERAELKELMYFEALQRVQEAVRGVPAQKLQAEINRR